MYDLRQLGLNVKKARNNRTKRSGEEFTQQQLAIKIGETKKWVKKLERGEFYPNWDALSFIADVCGVDIEFLIGENFSNEMEYQDATEGGFVTRKILADNSVKIQNPI